MIRSWKSLTRNAKKVCMADFFWNLGRTFPHAILTIFLMRQGCTLTQLAVLQSIYMVVAMLTEFPSGIWADVFSRKLIYLLSLVVLFLSYLSIGFFSNNFTVLCVSYALYGLSVSLKSGTLEAEVILELSQSEEHIKEYSIISSYLLSISSIMGGLIGSFLYPYLYENIYIISLFLFSTAFFFALSCSFGGKRAVSQSGRHSLYKEIVEGLSIIRDSKALRYILGLLAVSMLFTQPFFQYWQVLYQNSNVPEQYFGLIYILFQLCSVIGTAIYGRLKVRNQQSIVILAIIPVIYGMISLFPWVSLVALPLSVITFYVYGMHLDVLQKQHAPPRHISSFLSLSGTIQNIASIASLFIMASCINKIGIKWAYFIVFILFALSAGILQLLLNGIIAQDIERQETELLC